MDGLNNFRLIQNTEKTEAKVGQIDFSKEFLNIKFDNCFSVVIRIMKLQEETSKTSLTVN